MSNEHARELCKLLRWVEQMDIVIRECEAQPRDLECVRMARVLRAYRDLEIERATAARAPTNVAA